MANAIKLLTDQAITEGERDSLDFTSYAKVIEDVIIGTDGPFTIGIFGEWGTGKTSLMKIVENAFKDDENTIPVWFNAWRFEKEEHPIVPLIATIINALEKKKQLLDKHGDKGKSLITALRAIAYGFSSKTKINVPGMAEFEASWIAKEMIDREEKLSYDPLLEKSLYHQAFEKLDGISLSNGKKGIKIFIIIDDLDRCFPENSVKLLESIKLVLSQPGFLFMLGVSRKILEKYLQYKYKNQYGITDFQGNAYLDKIIQLTFDIPPHSDRMQQFTEKLIEQLEDKEDKKQLKEISSVVGYACKDNPRAVVRFINRLVIDKSIYKNLTEIKKEKNDDISIGYFAITRSLQQEWKDIFRLLTGDKDLASKRCELLQEWIKGEKQRKNSWRKKTSKTKKFRAL